MTELDVTAVIIGYCWPSYDNGCGIAVQSMLRQCMRVYSQVHFIGLVDHLFKDRERWQDSEILWTHIPTVRHSMGRRFLKSIFKPLPAITMQFTPRIVKQKVIQILADYKRSGQKVVVIFEDLHLACLLFPIKQAFPELPIALRSQNVATKAYGDFRFKGSLYSRLAWKVEMAKIQRFEKKVCKLVDRVWAISQTESTIYRDKLGIHCHGVFGVSLDSERYAKIVSGDLFTVICVGSIDLRKSGGMSQFVNYAWKDVRAAYPSAQFLLAGRNTEQFTQRDLGICGLGFCEDERDFLSKGLIFVNSQEDGAGVKLKSIVAMLAGKALISTEIGVEGIPGQNGEHFLVAKEAKDLAPLIVSLMRDQELAIRMGKRAQKLASTVYTFRNLAATAEPLLIDLANLSS